MIHCSGHILSMGNHDKNKLSGNHCASVRGVAGNIHAVFADANYSVTGHRRALLNTTCSVTGNRRALLTAASYSVSGHRRALL